MGRADYGVAFCAESTFSVFVNGGSAPLNPPYRKTRETEYVSTQSLVNARGLIESKN